MFDKNNREEKKLFDAEQRNVNLMREQQTVQQAEMINDQVAMQKQDERTDLLMWQQDLDDELEELKYLLRNYVKNNDGEWVPQQIAVGYDQEGKLIYDVMPPLMNEFGISKMVMICSPLSSRNMINSNISEERALKLLKRTWDSVVTDIHINGEVLYDMHFSDYSSAINIVRNVTFPTPFRAVNGWNKKIDSTISKRVEAYNESPQMQMPKKKWFGLF